MVDRLIGGLNPTVGLIQYSAFIRNIYIGMDVVAMIVL
jgi:hypothetical protein